MEKLKNITGAVLHSPSGLLVMPVSEHRVSGRFVCNRVDIPASCCPVSKNPREGSFVEFAYHPDKWVAEVYSLRSLASRFVGGFEATEHYPADRNMEGMVELMAQMVADAVDTDVQFRAHVVLDAGVMTLSGEASPR